MKNAPPRPCGCWRTLHSDLWTLLRVPHPIHGPTPCLSLCCSWRILHSDLWKPFHVLQEVALDTSHVAKAISSQWKVSNNTYFWKLTRINVSEVFMAAGRTHTDSTAIRSALSTLPDFVSDATAAAHLMSLQLTAYKTSHLFPSCRSRLYNPRLSSSSSSSAPQWSYLWVFSILATVRYPGSPIHSRYP